MFDDFEIPAGSPIEFLQTSTYYPMKKGIIKITFKRWVTIGYTV